MPSRKFITVRPNTKDRPLTKYSPVMVAPGGWSYRWLSVKEQRAAEGRWVKRLYEIGPKDAKNPGWIEHQCGGCAYFLAWDSDFGMCANKSSPNDGKMVFEHIGCRVHSYLEREPKDAP